MALVDIYNSTFYNNRASTNGSALYTEGSFMGFTSIEYSTFLTTVSTSTTLYSLLTFESWRGFHISDSILARTAGGSNCGGTQPSAHQNSLDSGSSCSGMQANVNAKLDPSGLKHNGGSTFTVALMAGSPAIDKGDTTRCNNTNVGHRDQRYGNRDSLCDMGAFEYGLSLIHI